MENKNELWAKKIALAVAAQGGHTYYVGGYVRDKLMGIPNKDVDIEVHGITPGVLETILDSLGERIAFGESFGIFNIKGCSLDIAMPRKEKCRGKGHRDFDVFVDPFIGTQKAAERRDFTVNALMQDVITEEIIDCFGGREDMKKGILRHVNPLTFGEDPLRVLRGAQFAARFGFSLAPETVTLCRQMDLSALAKERVFGELQKALLKAERPSVFFEVLRTVNSLSLWFPELDKLIGVPQSQKHHREGDAFCHTMMVLDAAATLRNQAKNPLGLMLAALTHDLGKALCTEEKNGEIHAYNHEALGLPLIAAFLRRLTADKKLTEYVLNLCEHHMRPNVLAENCSSVKATNKLFDNSLDPEGLILLALADDMGKIPRGNTEKNGAFLTQRLALFRETMRRPYVMGQDLIRAGLQPTPRFSAYLAYAHKLRLAGINKEDTLKQTLAYAKSTEQKKEENTDE